MYTDQSILDCIKNRHQHTNQINFDYASGCLSMNKYKLRHLQHIEFILDYCFVGNNEKIPSHSILLRQVRKSILELTEVL